jgi:hypothetical protein
VAIPVRIRDKVTGSAVRKTGGGAGQTPLFSEVGHRQ